jgi:hypothetical protein
MDTPFDFQPVIIIGAARSGTNMLRDMLACMPGVRTWPCDEINYIWRHHNATVGHDEFTPEHARPGIRKYIRRAFAKLPPCDGCQCVVEKTCANSLRVGFVDAVIPEAKYLFLVRDGRDVVASAMKRWTASLDAAYLLKKARFVPPSDLPYYAARYFTHRAYRMFSKQKRLKTWGPRFAGMEEVLAASTLEEVCAVQWSRSVQVASTALDQLEPSRLIRLKYETLVQQPESEFARVLEFLGLERDSIHAREATSHVSPQSVGNWRRALSPEAVKRLSPIVDPSLQAFGYATSDTSTQQAAA